jgi:malonate transporter
LLFVAFTWGWWRQGKNTTLSALCGMGMSCSNSGFVGYPIASQVVGAAPAAVALALCMIVENLLMIPLALLIADTRPEGGQHWTRVLMRSFAELIRKPLIVAILIALVVQLLRIPLFGPLTRTISILPTASTAVSLFVIGGSLVGLEMKGMRRDVSAIALGKLVLHPLLVGLFVLWLPPMIPDLDRASEAHAMTF